MTRCKLRNTVRRLKKKAMAENPNMRRGFLPIRSITKPDIMAANVSIAPVLSVM